MWRRPGFYMLVLYFSSPTGRLGFHFLFTVMTILVGNIIYSALVTESYEIILPKTTVTIFPSQAPVH